MMRKSIFIVLLLLAGAAHADAPVRIGILKFGTVSWELDVVKHHALDTAQGLALEITSLASKSAVHVVFQGADVDLIVSDWLWVSRQRFDGKDYSFIPYSTSLGAVVVPPGSDAENLRDLDGMRLGVAGSSLDKSWLLLRAWSQQRYNFDPLDALDVRYAAPPLLNGQIIHGKLDAVLNFWPYSARLEAGGYRRLIEMSNVVRDLGIRTAIPMVGYVFRESWAQQHHGIVAGFNVAVREARAILLKSDAEWERLRPLIRADDDRSFLALRDRYREGIPQSWGKAEAENAAELMKILANIGGKKLTGGSDRLVPGTFWGGIRF